jgi:2-oxoglutarate dehydrogenase E2 component (dihydrolipoamide succinyltransferase)
MAISVQMPALGESVTEGTVTRWLKKEGDRVEVDEPLLEVSTDKVDTEIPSPAAGIVQKIVVAEDQTAAVGDELAVIGDEASTGAAEPSAPAEQPAQQQPPAEQPAEGQADQAAADAQPEPAAAPSGVGTPGGGGAGTPVSMPALGESVTEGTVTRWLKQVGDRVEVDEPLLEVSTDKVDTEIPSPVAGTLLEISVREDETVPVGAQLALVGDGSGSAQVAAPAAPTESAPPAQTQAAAPAAPAEAPVFQPGPSPTPPAQAAPVPAAAPAAAAPQPAAVPVAQAAGDGGETANAYVTPLVRKLATEHGVDLSTLTGTGVGGRIRKQDVLEAAKAKAAAAPAPQPAAAPTPAAAPAAAAPAPTAATSPLRGTTEKMSRLRKVIATRMVESLQTSAQLTTVVEVDVTKIARLRNRAKRDFEAREAVKLSFLPFFAKVTVEALKAHPRLNASIDGDSIVYHAAEHLGIAVDTDRGLLVPVIRDAGDLNIAGLARKIADLADRTRSNKITPDELGGGTFTLTNTGSRGALFDTPIINQPQVGILGTGAVVKRAVVVDDADLGETIAVRSMAYLALSYDHRLVDGADAARFLATVKQRLEEGAFEADLGL